MGLGKKTHESLHNSIMPLDFDFMLSDQIVNMSMNGLRRRVATHHKNIIGPPMEKLSVALES
jgi:hypothetical protein